MTGWQIGLVVLGVAGAVALVVASARGMKAAHEQGAEIDRTLGARYFGHVAEGRYDAAWQECMSAAFRAANPREAFADAHARRRAARGAPTARELLEVQSTRTLFDPARTWQLRYRLRYADGEAIGMMVVTETDGEPRIDGTHRIGAADTLDPEIW